MKSMHILIDTNVIPDWLMNREPFNKNAKYIMERVMFGDVEGYLTGHTFPDLFYILRRDLDINKRKRLLLLLCEYFHVIAESRETIRSALLNER